ncbi:MAG: GNAT family N-acetyltransferase [Anaerolineae bacterium]|nr:GNAT family N-acetyltransferase [Anaerolineae bacterium]
MFEIETARLRLRVPVAADVDDYYRYIHSDAEVMRYLPGGIPRSKKQTGITLSIVIEHWQKYGFGLWAVEQKEKAEMIGHCGLTTLEQDDLVEVAYALGRPFWRRGYASEAARASLYFGFEYLKLPEIIAVSVSENIGSQRVMETIGMSRQGITRRFYGAELVLYTIKHEDFQPGDPPIVLQTEGGTRHEV